MSDLSDALRRVRTSGKPVIAYATGYSDDSYQLAAAASEIWLNPLGAVAIAGPGGSNLYYKGLLDKLGVTANVYRVGTYKSAVEPFIRNDMSPEAQGELPGARPRPCSKAGARACSRRGPAAKVDAYHARHAGRRAMRPAATWPRRRSRPGWSTSSATAATFEARLAELGGDDDGEPRRLQADQARNPTSPTGSTPTRSGPIGVVTVAGTIVDGKAPVGTAGGDSIAEAIERGLRDDGLKALVVRVDSPRRIGHRVRADPPGDPGRQGQEAAGRGVDGQCRGIRRLLGRDAGATSSSPSRRPSPDRSACSASCRASRARCKSSGSAPTGSRRRRCRASRTCSRARRPRSAA